MKKVLTDVLYATIEDVVDNSVDNPNNLSKFIPTATELKPPGLSMQENFLGDAEPIISVVYIVIILIFLAFFTIWKVTGSG